MGGDKAELRTGPQGPTFLEAIRRTLGDAGVATVRVVVAPGRAAGIPNAVVNPDPAKGMLSSIHCGLHAFDAAIDAALIWPVDHPRVSARTVAAIVDAFLERGAPVVLPVHHGRRGHPVLFSSATFHELI